MKDKKTVFVLGAGASCPCGYPSGARLRELICLDVGFMLHYNEYLRNNKIDRPQVTQRDIQRFKEAFAKSHIKSIDVFMSKNPKLSPIGKRIIAFEVLRAEKRSRFGEEAKREQERRNEASSNPFVKEHISGTADFIGGDWYSYLYNRLIEGLVGKDALPDFSGGEIAFITFNYDRSLEYFLYEGLFNLFTEVLDDKIVQYFKQQLKGLPANLQVAPENREILIHQILEQLKILHVYGQIVPLKWQCPEGVNYAPQINEELLQKASQKIRTIYEEKQNPELMEAQNLLKQAKQIFFLGFGYAPENMEVLGLPGLIAQDCWVYGTAFGANDKEVKRIRNRVIKGLRTDPPSIKCEFRIVIEPVDCLEILRNYWE
jgi:hypothetical protein